METGNFESGIELICDSFRSDLRHGNRPSIAGLLQRVSDEIQRERLLRALLQIDLEFCLATGTDTMVAGDTPLQDAASGSKMAFPGDPTFVDSRTLGNLDHTEVSISGKETGAEFHKAFGESVEVDAPEAEASDDGDSGAKWVGRYKLLHEIGEGGMGSVWMAEQQKPVKRRVALKLIKAGMDSRQVIARFEAERQALAMMDHQNIARVLDASTTDDGRPFFVMELVDGMPLTEFCDANRLTVAERLRLFIPVCNAIQHAHQKGIIHRDIKPSNVLVATYDGQPVPKVIDFGLAKALQTDLTDNPAFTQMGQVLGTLQYMSPEQTDRNSLDVDTRSDIYSLGVMLYELLTGSTPLERSTLRSEAIQKVLELIREKEPPRPSRRLSESGALASKICQQRKIEPRRLSQALRGDLDWIVVKALEKDRIRRYDTAAAFGEDVKRFLQDEPVEARPPSRTYRLKKMLKKYRKLAAATAALFLLLLIAVAGTTWGMIRAGTAERAARKSEETARTTAVREAEARQRAEMNATTLEQAFKIYNPYHGQRAKTPVEMLDRFADIVNSDYGDYPLTQATMLHVIGETFIGMAMYPKAESALQQAVELRSKNSGRDHPETLESVSLLIEAKFQQSEADEALPLAQQTLQKRVELFGEENPATLKSKDDLAEVYFVLGKHEEAMALARDLYETRSRVLGENHIDTLTAWQDVGANMDALGSSAEAVDVLEDVVARLKEHAGTQFPETLLAMWNLSGAYRNLLQQKKAIELLEETTGYMNEFLGTEHPYSIVAMSSLGTLYVDAGGGGPKRGLPIVEAAHEEMIRSVGESHPFAFAVINNLAYVYSMSDRNPEAIGLYRRSLRLATERYGENHAVTLSNMIQLGRTLYHDDPREAIALLEKALEHYQQSDNRSDLEWAGFMVDMADAYRFGDQPDKAEPLYDQAYSIQVEELGPNHMTTLNTAVGRAYNLDAQGKPQEGIETLQKLVEEYQHTFGADNLNTVQFKNELAGMQQKCGNLEIALQLYREVADQTETRLGADDRSSQWAKSYVASVLYEMERYDEARDLYQILRGAAIKQFGESDLDVVSYTESIAASYHEVSEYSKAAEYYQLAVEQMLLRLVASAGEPEVEPETEAGEKKTSTPETNSEPLAMQLQRLLIDSRIFEALADDGTIDAIPAPRSQYVVQALKLLQRRKWGREIEKVLEMASYLAVNLEHQDRNLSLPIYEQVSQLANENLDRTNDSTLLYSNNLAVNREQLRQFGLAATAYRDIAERRSEKLGPDHQETIAAWISHALNLRLDNRTDDAIAVYQGLIEQLDSSREIDDEQLLLIRNNLVVAWQNSGDHDLAIDLGNRVHEAYSEKYGPESEESFHALNNLAGSYSEAGQDEKSVSLYDDGLKRARESLGAEHLQTIELQANLATIVDSSRGEEAAEMLEFALKIRQRELGPEHPDTLQAWHNLAWRYGLLGRNREAVELGQQVYAARKVALGPADPETTKSGKNLAFALYDDKRHQAFIELMGELLPLREKQPGVDDVDNIRMVQRMAQSHIELNNNDLALQLARMAMERIQEKLDAGELDSVARDVLHVKLTFAHALAVNSEFDEAFGAMMPVFDAPFLDLPDAIGVVSKLVSDALVEQEKYPQAIQVIEKILALAANDNFTDQFRLNIANQRAIWNWLAGNYETAVPLLEDSIREHERLFGADHLPILDLRFKLGSAFSKRQNHDQALRIFAPLLVVQREQLGPAHVDTLLTMNDLAVTLVSLRDKERALPLLNELVDLRTRKLGKWHSHTTTAIHSLAWAYGVFEDVENERQWLQELAGILKEMRANIENGDAASDQNADSVRDLERKVQEDLKSNSQKLGGLPEVSAFAFRWYDVALPECRRL